VTKDELIQAIKETPLSEQDFQEILAALIETIMGNAFMGLGLDMLSGQVSTGTVVGRWVPANDCLSVHTESEAGYGWRGSPGSPHHEHWVVE
jgi:hypothetical protein